MVYGLMQWHELGFRAFRRWILNLNKIYGISMIIIYHHDNFYISHSVLLIMLLCRYPLRLHHLHPWQSVNRTVVWLMESIMRAAMKRRQLRNWRSGLRSSSHISAVDVTSVPPQVRAIHMVYIMVYTYILYIHIYDIYICTIYIQFWG